MIFTSGFLFLNDPSRSLRPLSRSCWKSSASGFYLHMKVMKSVFYFYSLKSAVDRKLPLHGFHGFQRVWLPSQLRVSVNSGSPMRKLLQCVKASKSLSHYMFNYH
ncbi:hypothetical protein GOODEAATRI_032171 [Goodea atripinnis]|uniref:Uncharacterized protein n=1 Tax=Goodea atripinnis TaxID=208336 RepID=A0ABV0NQZ9_9TELE